MEQPLFSPNNQSSSQVDPNLPPLPENFSQAFLNRLQNTNYLRIYWDKPLLPCLGETIYHIYTVGQIDDEFKTNENEEYLFRGKNEYCSLVKYFPQCNDGLNFKLWTCGSKEDLPNDSNYFCTYEIEPSGLLSCFCKKNIEIPKPELPEVKLEIKLPTLNGCKVSCCYDKDLVNLTMKTSPSKMEISSDSNEVNFAIVKRRKSYLLPKVVKKFYGYNSSDFKYQLGGDGCDYTFCAGLTKCFKDHIERVLIKNIKNINGDVEGGIYFCRHIKGLNVCGFCEEDFYEIHLPQNCTVDLKLLILGEAFEFLICGISI